MDLDARGCYRDCALPKAAHPVSAEEKPMDDGPMTEEQLDRADYIYRHGGKAPPEKPMDTPMPAAHLLDRIRREVECDGCEFPESVHDNNVLALIAQRDALLLAEHDKGPTGNQRRLDLARFEEMRARVASLEQENERLRADIAAKEALLCSFDVQADKMRKNLDAAAHALMAQAGEVVALQRGLEGVVQMAADALRASREAKDG